MSIDYDRFELEVEETDAWFRRNCSERVAEAANADQALSLAVEDWVAARDGIGFLDSRKNNVDALAQRAEIVHRVLVFMREFEGRGADEARELAE